MVEVKFEFDKKLENNVLLVNEVIFIVGLEGKSVLVFRMWKCPVYEK